MCTNPTADMLIAWPYAGSCEADIDHFCMDVMPGLGRLAICLSDQIKEEGKDGYSGTKATKPCRQELDTFRKAQSNNINLDLPLGMFTSRLYFPTVFRLELAVY